MEELISVVIPVYNVENYIKKCIDSVINQTYKNLEIILVDDGSTDKSGEICDLYAKKDNRIQVIHKKNGGLSDARNYGIERATGNYIGFIDSDDFIDIRMYEKLYNTLVSNKADVVICKPYLFEKYDEIVDLPVDVKAEIELLNKEEFFSKMYEDYLTKVVTWNKLYKKKLFEKVRYPKGKIIEDAAVFHYIFDQCDKIAILNQELYFYLQRNNSIMHKVKYNLLDELDALYDRILYFEKAGYKKKTFYINTLKLYIVKFFMITNMIKKELGFNKKIFLRYYKQFFNVCKKFKIKYINKFFKNVVLRVKILLKTKYDRINKKIFEKKEEIKFNSAYYKYVKKLGKRDKKYIIFNTPNHGNIGDHAILYAEKEILKQRGIESFQVMHHQTEYFIKKFGKCITKKDIIFITGGGNLGSLWEHEQINVNKVLKKFNNNKIIIFPQTVYYGNDRRALYRLKEDKKIYSNCKNLYFYCRDEKSYQFCKKTLEVKAKLITDVVTCLDFSKEQYNRKGILFCFREDKEKVCKAEIREKILKILKIKYPKENIKFIDTVYKGFYDYDKGKNKFLKFIKKVKKSKLFITDRLHGMLFAAITGTPCIAIDNKSGKVKGVYKTICEKNKYIKFIESEEYIEKTINELNVEKKYTFVNDELKKSLLEII